MSLIQFNLILEIITNVISVHFPNRADLDRNHPPQTKKRLTVTLLRDHPPSKKNKKRTLLISAVSYGTVLLTIICISSLQTCRSCSLLTYILLSAQRKFWWVRTKKTMAKPPANESRVSREAEHQMCSDIQNCPSTSVTEKDSQTKYWVSTWDTIVYLFWEPLQAKRPSAVLWPWHHTETSWQPIKGLMEWLHANYLYVHVFRVIIVMR